jgi:hypothetical protein
MSKATERKFKIKEAATAIGISPSGVRLLLNKKKLGNYQSGSRKVIGESHLTEYLSKIERNATPAELH